MAHKKQNKKRKTLVTLLSKSYGLGSGFKHTMSSFLGLNARFCRVLKLQAKHVLILKKKTSLMDFGPVKKENIKGRVTVLIRIKAYRGMRHKMKHPSRGQRTHTNGKTKKKFRY